MDDLKAKKITEQNLPSSIAACVQACQAKQAEGILVMDLRGISSFTDYFIIMHGNSNKQNLAIFENVDTELKKREVRPLSVEGKENADWILMDYGNFVVHIFSERSRSYYSLDKLWGDGVTFAF